MTVEIPSALVRLLREARSVTALTGAGASAESGVPTFRDALRGLWAKHDPEQLATPQAFARDPETVTRWYDDRRGRVLQCEPNAGHLALAEIERDIENRGGRFTLITQNVDRLHHAAGSRNIIEIHGSLLLWRCTDCGAEREERGEAFDEHPPRCECGGVRRPGVVWFGEMLPEDALAAADEAISDCNLFLSIGTSAVVQPAASFAHSARAAGAAIAEINREPTPLTDAADFSVLATAGQALPILRRGAFKQHE